jgi:hypothetical protein
MITTDADVVQRIVEAARGVPLASGTFGVELTGGAWQRTYGVCPLGAVLLATPDAPVGDPRAAVAQVLGVSERWVKGFTDVVDDDDAAALPDMAGWDPEYRRGAVAALAVLRALALGLL